MNLLFCITRIDSMDQKELWVTSTSLGEFLMALRDDISAPLTKGHSSNAKHFVVELFGSKEPGEVERNNKNELFRSRHHKYPDNLEDRNYIYDEIEGVLRRTINEWDPDHLSPASPPKKSATTKMDLLGFLSTSEGERPQLSKAIDEPVEAKPSYEFKDLNEAVRYFFGRRNLTQADLSKIHENGGSGLAAQVKGFYPPVYAHSSLKGLLLSSYVERKHIMSVFFEIIGDEFGKEILTPTAASVLKHSARPASVFGKKVELDEIFSISNSNNSPKFYAVEYATVTRIEVEYGNDVCGFYLTSY